MPGPPPDTAGKTFFNRALRKSKLHPKGGGFRDFLGMHLA
jgi:hypothetical protein